MIKTLVLGLTLAFTATVNAAFISNKDIELIDIRPTNGWTYENPDSLFDGITSQKKPHQPFRAYRNNGVDIGYNTGFGFLITLKELTDINSFSVYNDWGNKSEQSPTSLYIDFWGTYTGKAQDILDYGFYSLPVGEWNRIDLNINPVQDVGYMRITVLDTNTQGNKNEHFEIREFAIGATPVPAPVVFILFILSFMGLIYKSK